MKRTYGPIEQKPEMSKLVQGYYVKHKATGKTKEFKNFRDYMEWRNRLTVSENEEWSGCNYN